MHTEDQIKAALDLVVVTNHQNHQGRDGYDARIGPDADFFYLNRNGDLLFEIHNDYGEILYYEVKNGNVFDFQENGLGPGDFEDYCNAEDYFSDNYDDLQQVFR